MTASSPPGKCVNRAMSLKMIETRTDLPTALRNRRCAYCGEHLSRDSSTREHVIGKRFVPTGRLSHDWNLIVNACISCNTKKSDLEDDLSAISMQPDAFGRFRREDSVLAADAIRKAARSGNRATRKSVARSTEKGSLKFRGANLTITISTLAPPQTTDARVLDLPMLQIRAFFFFITYTTEKGPGGWWPGTFAL